MWRKHENNESIAKRISGIRAQDSKDAAKHDGGCGVVTHPVTGERIYWDA